MVQYVTRSLSGGTKLESDYNDSRVFTAFTDDKSVKPRRNIIRISGSSFHDLDGMPTQDSFRQGVSITQEAHRFVGLSPKLWSGFLKGNTTIVSLGQETGFVESGENLYFLDKQNPFAIDYVQTSDKTIFDTNLTELSVDSKVARLAPIETHHSASSVDLGIHTVKGNLEDGNQEIGTLNGNNSRISQFVFWRETSLIGYYNDQKNNITYSNNDIILNLGKIAAFSDSIQDEIKDRLSENTLVVSASTYNLDNDIREQHGVKSSAAGRDVYGPDQGQYGTDSIAFSGYFRGS